MTVVVVVVAWLALPVTLAAGLTRLRNHTKETGNDRP